MRAAALLALLQPASWASQPHPSATQTPRPGPTPTPIPAEAPTAAAALRDGSSDAACYSCYLRGGTRPGSCCASGPTCLPFDTYTLDRCADTFTRHAHLNCYPKAGAEWGTGDLAKTTHKAYTIASCEAACRANPKCDAITVEPVAGPAAFDWIRAIEAGPPGQKIALNASTYLIDRQYQLPPGTEVVGAGSGFGGPGRTVIKGVGPAYSSICGADAKNRRGLLLHDHT